MRVVGAVVGAVVGVVVGAVMDAVVGAGGGVVELNGNNNWEVF